MQPSTLSSWALLIWQELKSHELDPAQIFRQAGLDPALLSENMARYNVQNMTALWQKSLEASQDPLIGVKTGDRWTPTTFHALGFAWIASRTPLDAIDRLKRYSHLLNDALAAHVEEVNGDYRFSLGWQQHSCAIHDCAWDAAMATLAKMFRALLGENFSPVAVYTPRQRTAATMELENRLGAQIHCHSDQAYWLIRKEDAHRSIATGNEELARFNEGLARKYLAAIEKNRILPALQQALITALPSGNVNESVIAQAMNLSERTLQRKLEAEGLTFSNVLQDIRKELALQYIENQTMTMTEITYLLGFAEQASFTRAFKRWFGVAPSQFKKQSRSAA